MKVQLLGTGSSDGWPNPWCSCASCRAADRQGVHRASTSALVDGSLLLELGHDAPRQAARHGVSLAAVDTVLVTHGHADHHDPDVWVWRHWAQGRRPLTVLAPSAVADVVRPRLAPDDTLHVLSPGDVVTVAGRTVRALAASHGGPELGPALLYDVTAADGCRLLWATDTGPLSQATVEATRDAAYDVVLMELTAAPVPTHLGLQTWPAQVARLREVGAVTGTTRLGAIHLGHGCPPPDELDALLAGWGAWAPRDGEVLEVGRDDATRAHGHRPARVLVLGGARSGKSAWAEQRLASEPAVLYVATAPPRPEDPEWDERVARHRARRPDAWRTLETGDVTGVLTSEPGPVLVDDLGLWLTRVLDDADGWQRRGAEEAAADALVAAWSARTSSAVLVAPEVGGGVVPATPAGRLFRDALGTLTGRLAAASDEVVQVVAGLPRVLR